MAAVKGKNTSLERTLAAALETLPYHFQRNVANLPGKPDFVFSKHKLIVFVDGDFWHGWRFPLWQSKLQPYWQMKIARNRRRDRINFRKLRRQGWTVLRIWEHELKGGPAAVLIRIHQILRLKKRSSAV
jgi:DNA mismatch endonuclease (patch repair protein)